MNSKFNYWDIVHIVYAEHFAAKDGYGIVFDNSVEGKPYWRWDVPPIMGYINWHDGTEEFISVTHGHETFDYNNYKKIHKAKPITNEIIEGLRYNAYLMNKRKLIDNLSLIEILDKLNEHSRTIS